MGGSPLVRATRVSRLAAARRVPRRPCGTAAGVDSVGSQSNVTVADRDRGAGLRAELGQLVLDAEPGQPVGEVADGLVVVEVGLPHPAPRLVAVDDERLLPGRLDA